MSGQIRISQAAKELGVSAQWLRMLEWEGRIPPACRDLNSRIYSEGDIARLKAMGIGSRPHKLKRMEHVQGEER